MQLNLGKHFSRDKTVAFGSIKASRQVLLAMLMMVAFMTAGSSFAQSAPELINLINDYRNEERRCDKIRMHAVGPLAPHAGLSKVPIGADSDFQGALKAQGYMPARVQAISVSGPVDVRSVMTLVKKHYCRALLDPEYADIGVSREGIIWRIVLARPVLSPDLADWQDAGREILRLTNRARAESRSCGRKQFDAAQALSWAPELAGASLVHSRDMARKNYFRHRAKDGSRAADRVERKGYLWHGVGENIAAGQGSAKQVVSAWLSSPPHCANLMNPNFTEMGAAYSVDADSDSTIYWTQVFATPR